MATGVDSKTKGHKYIQALPKKATTALLATFKSTEI